MRALAIFTVLGLCTACVSPQRAVSTTQSTVAPLRLPPIRGAKPSWRYALPPGWDLSQVRIGDDTVVVGGRSEVLVLDPGSGRLRWHRDGGASAILVGETVVYGTATGAVFSRELRSGSVRWERSTVCSIPTPVVPGGVAVIVRNGEDLVVGCNGGRIVRMDAASGSVRARSGDAFVAEDISEIMPLGSCAYGVSGWSSGATLRQHAAILDCKRLGAIVREQDETLILGSIGNIAVLNDTCCNGRPDVYRPATIMRANLVTGALSPEVDLTPEPNRYPPDQRPLGQGSAAMLSGGELYLAVDRSLYRYGDPRTLSASPRRIAENLVDFPTMLRNGLIAVRVRVAGGAIADEIARVRNGALEPRWRRVESGSVTFGYDANVGPDVLTIRSADQSWSQTFVKTDDGAEIFVTGPCHMVGANKDFVVTLCTTNTLVGNRYLEYVAAYRWQAVRPKRAASPRDK